VIFQLDEGLTITPNLSYKSYKWYGKGTSEAGESEGVRAFNNHKNFMLDVVKVHKARQIRKGSPCRSLHFHNLRDFT
jgi:hypothetical protein